MTPDRMQALDEILAKLFRDDTQISTSVEPPPSTSVDQPSVDEPVPEAGLIEATRAGANVMTIAEQPHTALAGLDTDTAIRLRWALRDIKGKRTTLTPASRDDLRTLVEMELVEMHDDLPVLTNEGYRVLD